jgi:hypothetical protein
VVTITVPNPLSGKLGHNVFHILGFSGFCIFMYRNFNIDKINDENYMFRYALSIVHNLLINRKTSTTWGGIIIIIQKTCVSAQLMPSTD